LFHGLHPLHHLLFDSEAMAFVVEPSLLTWVAVPFSFIFRSFGVGTLHSTLEAHLSDPCLGDHTALLLYRRGTPLDPILLRSKDDTSAASKSFLHTVDGLVCLDTGHRGL
jgi:hypothetical protein